MSARQATLTSSDPAPKEAAPPWSIRVGEHLRAHIEPSLADWLDGEIWKETGAGEFHHAISPDTLLSDDSHVIWPGLMLPDTLPLLGNRYGDWLCLRVGPDNAISEIIHWYHGGGDWIPWGETLAEAVLFDHLREQLPGRRQTHAIEAETHKVEAQNNPHLAWAKQFIENNDVFTDPDAAGQLLNNGCCEVALRCEFALNAMDSSLRQKMTPAVAGELDAVWEPDVVSWLFDNNLVPQAKRSAVQNCIQDLDQVVQDWGTAAAHARAIAAKRGDLVWAFDVAGWGAERSGDIATAVDYYQQGVLACAFADQSIRFRSHWFQQWAGKFSTWRLCHLLDNEQINEDLLRPLVSQYLQAIRSPDDIRAQADSGALRGKAMAFWRQIAFEAVKDGRWSDAYEAFYKAGWDLGTESMIDFGDLLKGLVESAKRAGQDARAAVAEIHLQAFVARFG